MNRRDFFSRVASGALAFAAPSGYQIGAYYFPNYHVDPRNEAAHGKNWTEWELVKRGEPKFPGHFQPKIPLWGYEDESEPRVFEKKIAAAADHGLTHFIFDWYWYDDGPFLNRALDNGYLQARNNNRLQFCLMWANHDWVNIHPAKLNVKPPVQYPGAVGPAAFDRMTDVIVSKYFSHPSYWKIDGCPYFSFYQLAPLVRGLGGVDGVKSAIERFRQKTRAAGFPDLHLNVITWALRVLPGEKQIDDPKRFVAGLGFKSATSYVWVHHVKMTHFPETEYEAVARASIEYWQRAAQEAGLPYQPNVTMGWDPSPRTVQSDVYSNAGYPFTPTLKGNTPAAFKSALRSVKQFLDSQPGGPRIFNINAWNEWTEGSYLEPDKVNGMAYLEAIRDVFGGRPGSS